MCRCVRWKCSICCGVHCAACRLWNTVHERQKHSSIHCIEYINEGLIDDKRSDKAKMWEGDDCKYKTCKFYCKSNGVRIETSWRKFHYFMQPVLRWRRWWCCADNKNMASRSLADESYASSIQFLGEGNQKKQIWEINIHIFIFYGFLINCWSKIKTQHAILSRSLWRSNTI